MGQYIARCVTDMSALDFDGFYTGFFERLLHGFAKEVEYGLILLEHVAGKIRLGSPQYVGSCRHRSTPFSQNTFLTRVFYSRLLP